MRSVRSALIVGLVVFLGSRATAVVNQVDGLVVPVVVSTPCPGVGSGCLQTGLNFGENQGQSAAINSGVDAILDATRVPETFLIPKNLDGSYKKVRFWLLQEGAGFENIFGWYNVGAHSVRFPAIFSCKDADGDGVLEQSDRNAYEPPSYTTPTAATPRPAPPPASAGYRVEIDFQKEHAAGRYLGGQVGFYLVAPEGSANNGLGNADLRKNCATDPDDQGILDYASMTVNAPIDDDTFDEGDGHDDDNGFGRLYFTENKLNNDGNYVHYLIYPSAVNAEHFYFGFEDLFRGGDNDFEDILVKVEGLVPGCIPQQEVCNAADDNCNGQIDEGLTRPCGNAHCPGSETCSAGSWGNCSAQPATSEVCNGVDDNCDGLVDNGVPSVPCSVGSCVGQTICVNGNSVCDAPPASAELCDGLDNDCDGQIDDGVTRPCSSACGIGVEVCQFSDDGKASNDWTGCTAPLPGTEVCNGLDDDCDGAIDEDLPAGATCSVGQCQGKMVCKGGKTVCSAGAPAAEICDGLDNDCDGQTDEGLARACLSSCGVGVETCKFSDDGDGSNDWVGCNAPQPAPEICDGVDNDCDGAVDDGVPGEGEPCDHPQKTCKQGRTKCVGGKLTCVGATGGTKEICDCEDNDCDGETDEDSPCPEGTQCVECGCRVKCGGLEFGCPTGFVCKNAFCIPDRCASVRCAEGEACVDGVCVDPCAGISCSGGEVCKDGLCVANNCYGLGCPQGQVCAASRCIADPCANVRCAEGEFCSGGTCAASCGQTVCGPGASCKAGVCTANDPCAGVTCDPGIACIAGACDEDCAGVGCLRGQRCRRGRCEDDPCNTVRCFGRGEWCVDGQCISEVTFGERRNVLATGAGGVACAVGDAPSAPGPTALGLGLLALLWLAGRRRSLRRRLRLPLALGLLCALLGAGCAQDPLAVLLTDVYIEDPDGGGVCTPSNGGVEACDRLDNDCDGQIDEDFNVQLDPDNCGQCGNSCRKKGVRSVCELSACKTLGCVPGFIDLNEDLADGCEYECTATGDEVCDGQDNDCNGEIDELFDLQGDIAHCGACGNACQLAHAVARCDEGVCRVARCDSGYLDRDGQDANGCERPCTKTNDGVEICDGQDNDCNGVVDDPGGVPIDFRGDALNCGACNVVCALPNAQTACQAGQCALSGCIAPHVDANGSAADGCECLPAGDEVCDGLDNDCNGQIDDGIPSLGACGSSVGECRTGQISCQNGIVACQGAKGPSGEQCDGKDNDCDGAIDDGLPPLGVCGSSVGTCQAGLLLCVGGKPSCQGEVPPAQEICDGLDNDCNGTADDGLTGFGVACGTDAGECIAGVQECVGGASLCVGAKGATAEHCLDGKDTDCDGTLDPQACVYPNAAATRREMQLDQRSARGLSNSAQLAVAGRGQRVFAAWTDRRPACCTYDTDKTHCWADIYGSQSVDGGASWSNDVALASDGSGCDANNPPSKVEPQVAYGGGQRVYLAYERFSGKQRNVYLRRSDNGTTWSAAPIAVETSGDDALFVRLAVKPGTGAAASDVVVVCWERIKDAIDTAPNVFCRRSNDGGATFGGEQRVNAVANRAFAPELAIDDQNVYLAWVQTEEPSPGVLVNRIRVAAAPLSGAFAFDPAKERLLSGANNSRNPRIAAAAGGPAVVVWEDLPPSAPIDLRASRSADRGQSWSQPALVDRDVPLVNGDSVDPALALRGNKVYVAWADTSRGQPNIYVNTSSDGGQSFAPQARRVSAPAAGLHGASRPRIALSATSDNVYVVWEDLRNGEYRDIYFGLSLDDGATWNVPDYRIDESSAAGAADAREPFLWSSAIGGGGDRVAIIWLDNRTAHTSTTTGANADVYASYVD